MERIEFREDLNNIEYNLYVAQCLYLGEVPKERKKSTRVLKLCSKSVDRNHVQYFKDGKLITSHDGYVPDFFPENHYGDYIELEIDVDTGQILNWEVPTEKQLREDLDGI